MMSFIIGLLTVVLVLDCLVLILLILIQLPKKEAGAGIAFGGAATDALFGAGSGNALTNFTKYAAGFFLGLAFLLSIINAHRGGPNLLDNLKKKAAAPAVAPSTMTTNTAGDTSPAPGLQLRTTNVSAPVLATNPPASSDSPVAPPK